MFRQCSRNLVYKKRARPAARDDVWGGWVTTGQALLAGLGLAAMLVLRSRQSLDFIYFQF